MLHKIITRIKTMKHIQLKQYGSEVKNNQDISFLKICRLLGRGCFTDGGRLLKEATPLLMNFLSLDVFLQGGGMILP